jgi:hypothetical protein
MKTLVRTAMVAVLSGGLVYLLWQQERNQRVVPKTTIRNDTAEKLLAAMEDHKTRLFGLGNAIDDLTVTMGHPELATDAVSARFRAEIEKRRAK